MASVQRQNTLEDRLSDEEYKNWLKAGLCLFRVKEGLESFANQESDALHRDILAICQPCGNCTKDDLRRKKLCVNCDSFKLEIEKKHKLRKPSWNNTDVQKWPLDHWSVAKCFMNPGQSQHTSASAADISALLNLIINCEDFQAQGTYGNIQQNAEKVREHRNHIFHREQEKLQKTDLDDYTKNMIQLLRDENPDGKLKSNTEAEKARNTINEVLKKMFIITTEDEIKVRLTALEGQMAEVNEKIQTLQSDSTLHGQKRDDTLKDYYDNLWPTVKKLREKLKTVETLGVHLTTHDDEISKLKMRVEKLENNLSFIEHQMQEFRRDLDKLQGQVDVHEIHLHQQDVLIQDNTMQIKYLREQMPRDKVSCSEFTNLQRLLIKSYEPLQSVQMNPVCAGFDREIEVFYTDLVIVKENEDTLRDSESQEKVQIHSFKQLFHKDNERVHRIVFKAAAGLGKSTFCRKLVQIWCLFQNSRLNNPTAMAKSSSQRSLNEMKDGDVMLMFDILLFINLGEITGEKDFVDVIYTQIPLLKSTPKLSKNELINMMEEVEDNKILLILDGLDEMDASASYIEQILKRKLYPTMTVLVSSRHWKIGQLQLTQPIYVDLLVDVQGFSFQNSMLFAEKILEHYYLDKSASKQFKNDVIHSDLIAKLVHVPLLMLFLVHVWYKKKSFPVSVLSLYLEMLNVMVCRYEGKKDNVDTPDGPLSMQLKEFPNLQDLEITKSYGEEFFLSLCHIASHFLFAEKQESSLVFDERALLKLFGKDGKKLEVALNIGVLCKQPYSDAAEFTRRVRLSFPHKTIQELLAAIHLCCNESYLSQFLSRLNTYHDVLQNEIIIRFIAGISSRRGEEIFEKIFEACDDEIIYENIHKKVIWNFHIFTLTMWRENMYLSASFCKLYTECVREAGQQCTHFRMKHLHADSLQNLSTLVSSIKNVTDIRSVILEKIDFTSDQQGSRYQAKWATKSPKKCKLRLLLLRKRKRLRPVIFFLDPHQVTVI